MSKKRIYFDTETTGFDAIKNDIIEFAAIFEINGTIRSKIDIYLQPLNYKDISKEALDIQKVTIQDLKKYTPTKDGFNAIIAEFDKYVDKYNKMDKFIVCGHNVSFDLRFLTQLAEKMNFKYLNSYLHTNPDKFIDLLDKTKKLKSKIGLKNCKLLTIYEHLFNEQFVAHNALNDIEATYKCLKVIEKLEKTK